MKATCRVCRRQRPVMAGKRIYLACGLGITPTCPIGHDGVPGDGQVPCYHCSQLRRAKIQITAEAATIPQSLLADLFKIFDNRGSISSANTSA